MGAGHLRLAACNPVPQRPPSATDAHVLGRCCVQCPPRSLFGSSPPVDGIDGLDVGGAPAPTSTAPQPTAPTTTDLPSAIPVIAGMPPVTNAAIVDSAAGANEFYPPVAGAKASAYVPSAQQRGSGMVDVIDQSTMTVVASFKAGSISQHVVPSWDLGTRYVTASAAAG